VIIFGPGMGAITGIELLKCGPLSGGNHGARWRRAAFQPSATATSFLQPARLSPRTA
jgi:hypothetical protein